MNTITYALAEAFKEYATNISIIQYLLSVVIIYVLLTTALKIRGLKVHCLISVPFSLYLAFLLGITLIGRKPTIHCLAFEDIFASYIMLYEKKKYAAYDITFNIVAFIPNGFFVRFWMPFRKSCYFVLLSSLFIEAVQLFTSLGQFEICDIIDNTIGGLIGVMIYYVCSQCFWIK